MKKKKILIIDDEKDFTELVKLNLEATDKYIVWAENKGAAGLAVAREFEPDLILLDIMMPDIGGDQVAHQIKDDPSVKNIPIVFLTAVAEKENVASWGRYFIPGYPFIAKPVSAKELIGCIEENLRK